VRIPVSTSHELSSLFAQDLVKCISAYELIFACTFLITLLSYLLHAYGFPTAWIFSVS
jgi:hypothetical protein